MTSQGSAAARFRRALATGNPLLARAALAELPRVEVEHALAVLLLHRDREPARYERMAIRLHAKLCRELALTLPEALLALAALAALAGEGRDASARALGALLDRHGLAEAARLLDGAQSGANAGRRLDARGVAGGGSSQRLGGCR